MKQDILSMTPDELREFTVNELEQPKYRADQIYTFLMRGASSFEEINNIPKKLIEKLNDFIKGLDRRNEFIFVCRYYYCDSIIAIADMLGVSRRTIERALATMREELTRSIGLGGNADEG